MPKKKKGELPSGSIRVRVYVGRRADGTRRYESFTGERDKVRAEAAAFKLKVRRMIEQEVPVDDIPRDGDKPVCNSKTVSYYLDQFVNTCRAVGLSPATILEYQRTVKRGYSTLKNIPAAMLTVPRIQEYVNLRAESVSAKTIRNELGILISALSQVRPDLSARQLRLPRNRRTEMKIPTDAELQTIMRKAKGTPLYLPVILASMMGLRRSEILALTWNDVDLKRKRLHIHAAMVMGEDGLTTKAPKTEAGDRVLPIPSSLIPVLKSERTLNPHLSTLTPDALTARWIVLMKSLGLPYRFHDLRHYHASAMIAVGAPDKYICADMGHASMDMVRRVYGHIMEDREREIHDAMEERTAAFSL